ncbi:MAG: LON peptidase substrate-binding domain-containing protein, partial [Bacteroidota bacterium]|nr:LON peptidase substrate-binding domain-containing protein [Bacteroidota bacterium]
MSTRKNNKGAFADIYLSDNNESSGEFIPLIADEDDDDLNSDDIPKELPILPLRNTVLFPGVILPITVGREKSVRLINEVYKQDKMIGAVAQIDPEKENPEGDDLYKVGTVAQIVKVLEMPDGSTSVIIQGKHRFELEEMVQEEPYHKAKISVLPELVLNDENKEFDAIVGSLKDLSLKIIKLSSNIPPEASFAVKNIENTKFLVNFICSNSDIEIKDKQNLLKTNDLKIRSISLLEHLSKEIQMLELKKDIQSRVKVDIDKQQREYLLQQQMRTIQDELGDNPSEFEIEEFKKKAKGKKWNKDVAEIFNKELNKLQRLNPASGEYSVQINYLQTLVDLPWNEFTKDNFDLKRAQKVLDDDHFGLEKVKERILEYLAVLKLKGDLKSPILCLYGPPGVGKTSLGKSIARA